MGRTSTGLRFVHVRNSLLAIACNCPRELRGSRVFVVVGLAGVAFAAFTRQTHDETTTVLHPISGPDCGKRLVNDVWQDGDIDAVYARHCYESALASIPDDVEASDVRDVLRRGARRG